MSSSSGLLELSESNGMPRFQQSLSDKDYQEFEGEISGVLNSVFREHGSLLARAWVPCVLNRKCGDGRLGLHQNSVFILDGKGGNINILSNLDVGFRLVPKEMSERIVRGAFMTNQAFITHYWIHWLFYDAAIAVPLRSSIHNSECVFEFSLRCIHTEQKKKMVTALFSTLKQCCRTLRVVADKVLDEPTNSTFLAFPSLQPFDTVEQSVAKDSLIHKENPREADLKRMMQLLPESSDQNERFPDPTPRIEPAKTRDAIGLGSLAPSETSEERHATGEKTVNVPNISLNDSAKSTGGFPGLFEPSEGNGITPSQQSLWDKAKDQEFEREISDVLDSALIEHGFLLARAWIPCHLSGKCRHGWLGNRNSVFLFDVRCNKNLPHMFDKSGIHKERGEDIVGKAFMTNQAFFSRYPTDTSKKKDPLFCIGGRFDHATIAVPLRRIMNNCECVFEFFFPFDCTHLEQQKKMATALLSTLIQRCRTLRVIARKVIEEDSKSTFLAFPFLQPFDMVELSVAKDSLIQKENPREADPKRVMQLSPESSDQNERCPDPTPRIEPAKMCDAIGLVSSAAIETSEERHATGEKTVNVPNTSLNNSAKSTGGKSTGGAGSKRHWAWDYCTPIPGNSNGVKCSFCDLEIKGGGITRFTSHISGSDPSKNVKKCKDVPPKVIAEIEHKGKKRR